MHRRGKSEEIIPVVMSREENKSVAITAQVVRNMSSVVKGCYEGTQKKTKESQFFSQHVQND